MPPDPDEVWIDDVRALLVARGPGILAIDDLRVDDLDGLAWSGGPLHVRYVARSLERAAAGEVDCLAVRAPCGRPVAKGGVDFADGPLPKLWQLVTHPGLQGLGVGSRLIAALEARAQSRGHQAVGLGVEESNPRALALYERLGYQPYGRERSGWEQQNEAGRTYWYETELILMRREIGIRRKSPDASAGRRHPMGNGVVSP